VIKDAMFDYMRTKNGNIIAVVDKKKESIVQYLKQYQKEFRSSLSKKTEVCLKSLKSVGKRENELCSNGNREYLDDKTTIAAMLSLCQRMKYNW
jgi:uncharacterized protein (UPF0210 family)